MFKSPVGFAETPPFTITQIADDLYVFSDSRVNGVLLVSKEGVVVVDPGPEQLAVWLKDEIARRFKAPVFYVIYANDQPEHFSGGPVFRDTAQYLIHIKATGTYDSLRETGKQATAIRLGNTYKVGKNEFVIYANGQFPALKIFFKNQDVLYATDLVQIHQLPESLFSSKGLKDYVSGLFNFDWKNFKIFVGGHGAPGTKQDVQDFLEFVETLLKQVFLLRQENLSPEEILKEVNLSEFQGWGFFQERRNPIILETLAALEQEKSFENLLKTGLVFPISLTGVRIPEKVYKKEICGWVVVEYDVIDRGDIRNIKVVEEVPNGVYGLISIESARRFRFVPGFPGQGVKTTLFYNLGENCAEPPGGGEGQNITLFNRPRQ